MSSNPLAPFSCTYTPQLPELLYKLGCSIAISTYQAGKIIFLSPKNEESIIQLPRTFNKPMGIALDEDGNKMAIATKDEVIVLANSKELATHYPKSPNKYDAMFMPRTTYHTAGLDLHDVHFGTVNGQQKIFAVNTLFSCIVSLDDTNSFIPYWTPPQIAKIESVDACHLNGMAMVNGKPKYATSFNQGNTHQSWREKITETGTLYDIETNEIILDNLAMPHSPKMIDGELYVLQSANGELIKVDPTLKKQELIYKFKGFVRGMAHFKDYLFVGLSKIRKNSSTFAKLPFVNEAQEAGIVVIHLPTRSMVGKISYTSSVDELYEIQILENKLRPNILNTSTLDYKSGLMTPTATFWSKMES
jgi:uncharacterized protein (TIGR03032 family)